MNNLYLHLIQKCRNAQLIFQARVSACEFSALSNDWILWMAHSWLFSFFRLSRKKNPPPDCDMGHGAEMNGCGKCLKYLMFVVNFGALVMFVPLRSFVRWKRLYCDSWRAVFAVAEHCRLISNSRKRATVVVVCLCMQNRNGGARFPRRPMPRLCSLGWANARCVQKGRQRSTNGAGDKWPLCLFRLLF